MWGVWAPVDAMTGRTAAALVALGMAVSLAGPGGRADAASSSSVPREPTLQVPTGYVGSAACRDCHTDQYDAWAGSTHGTAGGAPSAETVIAPFDGQTIRFADALVRATVGADGDYAFEVERPERPVLRLIVDGVIGRGHMVGGGTQGFVSTFPDGTRRFLPFDYSEDLDAWFCNTAFVAGFWVPGADRAGLRADEGWLPITEDMAMSECGDWPPARILGTNRRFANCQNCHGSQVQVSFEPELGRYRTDVATLQINCESCHGPGAAHVEGARSGRFATSEALEIGVLDTLSVDASLGVCLQCHALKRALTDQASGGDVAYSLGLPLIGGDLPYLPDGRIRTFGYQQNHRASACYLSGSMTCVDCHEPHGQTYRDPFGTALEGRFDDGQCTACHASKAVEPERHTFHPPGSDGARCVSCHMPYLQHPSLGDEVPYARSDHTIPIPRPGFDEGVGLISACAGCHQDVAVGTLESQVRERWGVIQPHRAEVQALVTASRGGGTGADALLAATDAGSRAGLAKLMALDRFVTEWIREDAAGDGLPDGLGDPVGAALATLAADEDPDVRAVALAALHVTRGGDGDVRALLDEARRGIDDDSGLARRWAAALIQWSFVAGNDVGPEAQMPFLRRAQEVRPRAPETLVNLAAGLAETGDWEQSVQVYLEALRHSPDDPVALVNLGLGLEVLGRVDEAEGVYERAASVRPTEAVAHLNLGNARYRRGDFQGAIESYRSAVTYDPGLSRAHFYLGIALVNTGRPREGLPRLYDALEFAPDDPEILQVIREVEAALGRE